MERLVNCGFKIKVVYLWVKIKYLDMRINRVLFLLLLILGSVGFNLSAVKNYPEPTAKDNRWGYAYLNGGFRLVIGYEFDEADSFDAELPRARVRIGNDYYLIDDSGRKCAGPYDHVTIWADPSTGYYVFSSGGKEGVIDMNGRVLLEPKYTNIGFYEDGTVAGLLNGDFVEIKLPK